MQDKFYEILSEIKNILIYCYARIGDAAVTLILTDNLGYYFKDKDIFILCSETNYKIFENKKYIKKIYIWPKDTNVISKDIDIAIFLAGICNVRDFDVYKFLRENLKCIFLGYVKNWLEGCGFDICIYHNKTGNIVERVKKFTKFLTKKHLVHPTIEIPLEVEEKIKQRVLGNKNIYINLSAGDKSDFRSYFSRNLPLSIYDKLIDNLVKRDFLVTVTAAPWDKDKFEYLKQKYINIKNVVFIETPDLFHLIAVLKMANIVVTPETSVVHIASVLNKPIVGIYDSFKKYKEWPPWSEKFEVIIPKIPKIMSSLNFNDLYSAINKFI